MTRMKEINPDVKVLLSKCDSMMFNKKNLEGIAVDNEKWQRLFKESVSKTPEKSNRFSTVSDSKDIGFPGQYPFTRGVQPSMYRGKLWTMRMFAGLGSARDTNKRFHLLVNQGQTGLSTAFDMPTLMGYDTDSPRSRGESGRCGVAIDTLRDMEILFDDLCSRNSLHKRHLCAPQGHPWGL
jgi:methylmalonyl-CoA mutase N-terminal domain/subunit